MAIATAFAGVVTADIAAATAWYERLFARPPDMRPHDLEACWQLVGDAWFYVVEDGTEAGGGLLTLLVDDLEAVVAGLRARGLDPGAIEQDGKVARKSVVTDPEGTRIAFAQVAG